ncbi:hypothetical protein CPB86DRAFT_501348 [Serendipita vermifera]|nr:hypothetical protein CPB86DRAFT_501348 [Serendipita vermifera]
MPLVCIVFFGGVCLASSGQCLYPRPYQTTRTKKLNGEVEPFRHLKALERNGIYRGLNFGLRAIVLMGEGTCSGILLSVLQHWVHEMWENGQYQESYRR